MRAYFWETTDPAFNLAAEESLMSEDDETFLLWRNHSCVVIGRNQDPVSEINQKFAETAEIPYFRRNSGGGAVYHDEGTINFSFLTDSDMSATVLLGGFLRLLDIKAATTVRNDVLLETKKIVGTAQWVQGTRRLFHGSLLYDTDLETLCAVLTPSSEKLARNGVASVRSRVDNLRALSNDGRDADAFFEALKIRGEREFKCAFETLPREIVRRAEILKLRKYSLRTWNRFGDDPAFTGR